MDLLKELNDPQKKAVLHKDGPLLVVAGAGAGKTKVITHRIAYLIQEGVRPEQILAVTFTNKAANEMKERINKLITKEVGFRRPTVGTFHSICNRILRQNGHAINLPNNFSILDKEDSLKIIKNCLKEMAINPKQFQPSKIQNIISREKSNLVKLEEYTEKADQNFFPQTVATIWQGYESKLTEHKAVDFDDLIAKTVFLFQDRPDILKKYQKKWQYILIDEYQDTNRAQYMLSILLAKEHKNICAVGDEDQSIYRFRGADFGNILRFEKDWPNVKTVMLEQNYRSTQKILEAANAVIGQNKMRKPKNLFSQLEQGEKLTLFDALNEKEEAEFVAITSKNLISGGLKPFEIAVFYRANFQSRVLEESFLEQEVPYQIIGTRFFERKEVKDIISYLKVALNPNDLLSLKRIINEPPRGLGKTTLENHFSDKKITADKKIKMKQFFDFLNTIKKVSHKETLPKTLNFIIKKSGYYTYLNNGSEEGMMRLDNLKELLGLSLKYEKFEPPLGAEKFLEDTALMTEQDYDTNKNADEKKGKVRLMTVHAAKGLEFPCAFITGLEEGLFPFSRFGGPEENEEERRLFYVALTRAKQKLFLSFSCSRSFFGSRQINKPSHFINEIPPELFNENFGIEDRELPTTNYLDF